MPAAHQGAWWANRRFAQPPHMSPRRIAGMGGYSATSSASPQAVNAVGAQSRRVGPPLMQLGRRRMGRRPKIWTGRAGGRGRIMGRGKAEVDLVAAEQPSPLFTAYPLLPIQLPRRRPPQPAYPTSPTSGPSPRAQPPLPAGALRADLRGVLGWRHHCGPPIVGATGCSRAIGLPGGVERPVVIAGYKQPQQKLSCPGRWTPVESWETGSVPGRRREAELDPDQRLRGHAFPPGTGRAASGQRARVSINGAAGNSSRWPRRWCHGPPADPRLAGRHQVAEPAGAPGTDGPGPG